MMESLGAPQTHLSLKKMIQEVDTDGDSKISFNEVSHIYFTRLFNYNYAIHSRFKAKPATGSLRVKLQIESHIESQFTAILNVMLCYTTHVIYIRL